MKKLIEIATTEPVIKCQDLDKPFKLVVDASAFAIGTVLCQKDEKGKVHHVGYFSKALNPMEQNYNIWD